MSLSCPYKPVAQRTAEPEPPHVHRFVCEMATDDLSVWVQDCTCGFRRLVRKGAHGEVLEILPGAIIEGGSSLDNVVFLKGSDGKFHDRWSLTIH